MLNLACGTPVVTSTAGSLPEVVGDAALTAEALDTEGLAQAVYRVLTDGFLRRSLVQRGLTHVKQYNRDRVARQVLEVYERVAS